MSAITGQPAYQRIAEDLKGKIADGTYPVGSALPSTSQLMSSYDVSSTAARGAVRELQSEGIVVGQPGKAVYVQRKPGKRTKPHADESDLKRQLEALSETVRQLDKRVASLEAEQKPR